MTQKDLTFEYLKRDRQWHHTTAVSQHVKPGAVCMAVSQTISKLKKDGHVIESRISSDGHMAEYRLVRTADEVRSLKLFDVGGI